MSTDQSFEEWEIKYNEHKAKDRRLTYGRLVRRLFYGKNKNDLKLRTRFYF